ncbi:MAG: cobalt-precorrin-5B (C(1))-methyltransferase CbiD [Coriobacteriia bacterium]|nr:cobalt-precorrin-5B (C(1))-methyltransferase CbiD [Coriobacteriia bacterium]
MTELRRGLTTGLCAAAAAYAATYCLLSQNTVHQVSLPTSFGELVTLPIAETVALPEQVRSGVIKDAGDDPDVTHGATVYATVSKTEQAEIDVDGGEGIGRVSKPGLKVAVGKAAINPVPLAMITSAIELACDELSYQGGIKAVISIPGGEELAKKTMNARLGVIGGLSILGTTGIVSPMSNQALIDTIKTEIDVLHASGSNPILMMPGNYGRSFARDVLGLNIDQSVRFANFVGEALDHIVASQIKSVMLVGHAGKLVKLAGGIMNTHSSTADCRMEIITAHAAMAGASAEIASALMSCTTTEAAIEILFEAGISQTVWQTIGQRIAFYLEQRTRELVDIDFIVFTDEAGVLIQGKVLRNDKARETEEAR